MADRRALPRPDALLGGGLLLADVGLNLLARFVHMDLSPVQSSIGAAESLWFLVQGVQDLKGRQPLWPWRLFWTWQPAWAAFRRRAGRAELVLGALLLAVVFHIPPQYLHPIGVGFGLLCWGVLFFWAFAEYRFWKYRRAYELDE